VQELFIILYIATTSAGLITFKLGSKAGLPIKFAENGLSVNLNFYNVLGLLLYCTSFLLYMYLVSKNDLGYIIPLTTGFVYIVIFTASFIVFKEVFTIYKVIGIILIVAGLIFLNSSK